MKITIEKLDEWNADKKLKDEVVGYFKDKCVRCGIEKLIKDGKVEYANWILCRILDKRQKTMYAIFAAEQILPLFEKKYPRDKRPRIAIERAKEWLKNPEKQDRIAGAVKAAREAHTASLTGDCVYADSYAACIAAHVAAYAAQIAGSNSDTLNAVYAAASAISAGHAYAFTFVYSEAVAIVESDADAFAFADVYSFSDFAGLKKEMMKKIIGYGLKQVAHSIP